MRRILALVTTLCLFVTSFAIMTVSVSADTGWTSGWEVSGNASAVTIKGDTIRANVELGGAEAEITKTAFIDRSFDFEWTMKMENIPGSGTYFLLYTGSERHYVMFHAGSIKWEDNDARTGAKTYRSVDIDLGTDEHTYRMVGEGGGADIYVDGFYIASIEKASASSGAARWTWYAAGTTGKETYTISDVTVNKFTGRGTTGGGGADTEVKETTIYEDMIAEAWTDKPLLVEDVFFGFDKREDYNDWVIQDCWSFEDGIAKLDSTRAVAANYNLQHLAIYGSFGIEKGQDFVFTTKFRVNQFDEQMYINVMWPGYGCRAVVFPEVIEFDSEIFATPHASDSFRLASKANSNIGDGKWHEYQLKTSQGGTKVQLFMDGKAISGVVDAVNNNSYNRNGKVYLSGMANASYGWDMEFDWVDIKIIKNDINIDAPMRNAEYLEGVSVPLRASLKEGVDADIPSVDYKIDGRVVATGMAPDYRATIEGLGAGSYTVVAEYEDYTSGEVEFTVREAIKGYLEPQLDDAGNLTAKVKFLETNPKIDKVEYYLDGNLVATTKSSPYSMNVPSVPNAGHTLEAVYYDKNNIVLGESSEKIIPVIGNKDVSENYSNDITYSVSGDGNAEIIYSNGRHQLKLNHTKNSVTCLTDAGEETYEFGSGNYRIMTDGPVVEGYYNGQFVFSYYMPMTDVVEKKITENGVKVNDFKVIIPEERNNYFFGKNINGQNVYRLGETTANHVIDFKASASDHVHIAMNDGFYRTDLTLKDGKFYAWTSKEITSEPFVEEQLGAVASNDETYYRIETAIGMTRVFANGRWIATFRNIQASGEPTLAVDVMSGGGLSYLSVGDLSDIYYYEDDFRGKGKFDSDDYFRMHNGMGIDIEYASERLNLTARGNEVQDAMAEINANLGDFDLSTDVRVKKNTKGFWIYYNRPTTVDYSKAGYNFKTKEWEIVNKVGSNKKVITAPGEFPQEELVHLDLKVRTLDTGKEVTLYMNDQPVISQDNGPYERGRLGFAITDGSAYIENFYLRGDSKPMLAVNHYVHGLPFAEGIELGDGLYRFYTRGSGYAETRDEGMSFTKHSYGGSANPADEVCKLPNGELLSVATYIAGKKDGKNVYNAKIVISNDGGQTWENIGDLVKEPSGIVLSTGGRLKVGASGRVYFMASADASENPWNLASLYFSDDNGRTWQEGGLIRAEDIGATIVEQVVVEAEGEELHCYTRTDQGCILKIISYDRGLTWDTDNVYKTPFLAPECCMNVEADHEYPNIFYMTWSNDNDNLSGKGQYPRTNQSLAISYDYGKMWHFYGKPFENNSRSSASATTNMNFEIFEDFVVITSPSYDDVTRAGGDKPRHIFIPKDKQVVSKRWERLYPKWPGMEDITMPVTYDDINRVLAVHPESGTVLLRGRRVADVVADGMVSAEVLASYLGGTVKDGENGKLIFVSAGSETIVSADSVSKKNGKKYVDPVKFAEAVGLFVEEEKGVQIISSFENLGVSQKEALRYGLDFFTDKV